MPLYKDFALLYTACVSRIEAIRDKILKCLCGKKKRL